MMETNFICIKDELKVIHKNFTMNSDWPKIGFGLKSRFPMATDTFSKNPQKGGPALQEAPDTDHSSAERALPHAIGPEKSILSSMF